MDTCIFVRTSTDTPLPFAHWCQSGCGPVSPPCRVLLKTLLITVERRRHRGGKEQKILTDPQRREDKALMSQFCCTSLSC